jgi:hypothetical protein
MSRSGAGHGVHSPFTYASYVYFEKLRVKEGKPKSKKRTEMDVVWGKKQGLIAKLDLDQRLWKHQDDRIYVSQFGEIELTRSLKEPERNDGIERKWKCYS